MSHALIEHRPRDSFLGRTLAALFPPNALQAESLDELILLTRVLLLPAAATASISIRSVCDLPRRSGVGKAVGGIENFEYSIEVTTTVMDAQAQESDDGRPRRSLALGGEPTPSQITLRAPVASRFGSRYGVADSTSRTKTERIVLDEALRIRGLLQEEFGEDPRVSIRG